MINDGVWRWSLQEFLKCVVNPETSKYSYTACPKLLYIHNIKSTLDFKDETDDSGIAIIACYQHDTKYWTIRIDCSWWEIALFMTSEFWNNILMYLHDTVKQEVKDWNNYCATNNITFAYEYTIDIILIDFH